MTGAAERISNLSGWRRYGVAALSGAFSTLALAPLHFFPVMFITIPVLIWLLDGCVSRAGKTRSSRSALRSAALTGWWFGFGYFLFGLYWIGFAFLVEAEIFAVFLPFAITLMPAGLALFFAAACGVTAWVWRPGVARILALAVSMSAVEWLRGKVLTGFPWNTLGYTLTGNEAMMQPASLFGIYTLTLFAMLIFSAPAIWWASEGATEPRKGLRQALPVMLIGALAAGTLWGYVRLAGSKSEFVPNVRLRIVQPNIPQAEKWKPENRAAIFQRYLKVSKGDTVSGKLKDVTHLLWPESAVPFLLADTPEALNAISELLPKGATFITGAARGFAAADAPQGLKVYNSLYVMDDQASIVASYDKVHLVPFGEYLPFQDTLESIGLAQLTRIRGGFSKGENSRVMKAAGIPDFVALICYEIIFPDRIAESGRQPGWMLNVTNDAWFGMTSGPHQHFHQSRVRAVEQGLPLVRVANTGISAVVDPYGRIVSSLPQNQAIALDSALPDSLPDSHFRNFGIFWFFFFHALTLLTYLRLRKL